MKSASKIFIFIIFYALLNNATSHNSSMVDEEAIEAYRILYTTLMEVYRDTTADPCDDFYKYACGNFENVVTRPRGVHEIGAGIRGMGSEIEESLQEIFENYADADNNLERKVKDFYHSCVNGDLFNYKKSEVFLEFLESFGGFPVLNPHWSKDNFNWWTVNARLNSFGIPAILEAHLHSGLEIDLKNFQLYRPIDFGDVFSLGYVTNCKIMKKILDMYDVSEDDADWVIEDIMEFLRRGKELQIHSSEMTGYPYAKTEELMSNCSTGINWCEYFNILFDGELKENLFVQMNKNAINKVWEFMNNYPNKKAIANYMMIKALFNLHAELSKSKYTQQFCISQTKRYFEGIPSRMFIQSSFYDENAEKDILEIVESIRSAFINIIASKDWLDEETKKLCIEKIKVMQVYTGIASFRTSWDDLQTWYGNVEINKDNYHKNLLNLKHNTQKLMLQEVTGQIQREIVSQVDVNAAYVVNFNKIMINSASLSRPLYFPEMPKSYNYATIGTIIAHEFTHALDSSGYKYDKNGDEFDWWTPESIQHFEKRLECVKNYFGNFTMESINVKIDGEKTLGENVADSGGMQMCFNALQKYTKDKGLQEFEEEILSWLELTSDQFFFLSFAQGWCNSFSKDRSMYFEVDEHTHDKYRVIGTLANIEAFSKAFNCPVGSPMNPSNKCVVW